MTDVSNVSVGKPKIGGAIYVAPKGTTLPVDAKSDLDPAFKELGYVSEDGLTNDNSMSSDEVKAWGGDTVLTLATEKNDKFSFSLIEILNVNVLKVVFGDDNVSGTLDTGITVRSNNSPQADKAWVIEMIFNGNTLKRIVIQNANVSEVSEVTYKDDEAVAYEVTINAKPGNEEFDFDTHKEYIVKAEGGTEE